MMHLTRTTGNEMILSICPHHPAICSGSHMTEEGLKKLFAQLPVEGTAISHAPFHT